MRTRMRRPVLASALVCVALTLTSCGDSGPSDDDLADVLLTESDMPDGFEKAADDDDDEDDDPFEGTCLDAIDDVGGDSDADAEADASFETGEDLPTTIEVSVGYFDDKFPVDLDALLDDLKDCTEIDTTSDDVEIQLAVDAEKVEVDGADDGLSLKMTGTFATQGQSFPVDFGFVIAEVDNYGVVIGTLSLGSDTEVSDSAVELAEKQIEKLDDVA